jgi:hypothetical protein
MKHDSEGFNRSSVGDLESYLLNKLDSRLRVSVIHAGPMSQTKRKYLEYIKNHPRCNMRQIVDAFDTVSANKEVGNFINIGYVDKSEKFITHSRFTITEKGLQALGREAVDPNERAKVIKSLMVDYEPFVPEKDGPYRQGSQDAFKLQSKGIA